MHAKCNLKKGAANLEIARLLWRFDELEEMARRDNGRGANLDDILANVGGKAHELRLKVEGDSVRFTFSEMGDPAIVTCPLYTDPKSDMRYFFTLMPIEFLSITMTGSTPRTIGRNLKGLMEEFYAKRPQLHVSLAWWKADNNRSGGSEGI